MSENQSLKEKTAKGLFWGGFSNGIQQLLNLLFGIFLARLLTPSDYGMVGMLAIFSLIASSIQESGFTAALVNKKEVTHNDYNAVFWFNAAISIEKDRQTDCTGLFCRSQHCDDLGAGKFPGYTECMVRRQ